MGREVWTIIQDASGKTVWDSAEKNDEFFCGRNECTDVLAYCPDCDENDEIDFTDVTVYNQLKGDLLARQEQRYHEYDRLYDCIHDAKMARRNAQTLEAFEDFTAYIDEQQGELDSTCWSLGDDMIQLMLDTLRKAVELCCNSSNTCPAITDEERVKWLHDQGWKVKWIVSE